ncbi:type II toxin-antitoxin system RelE/ParE family toxin [uncultured Paraglaciecola sp.]|uniref:type II toxin-antitoxin system RelE/ParE family toxin n=1 Tax=uncultured Paraglaciecola sp. TaxID=1765024 RepID=UPI0026232942|nr:type II toxin-antitoxin system RelE/ParE family toxin [uncultured Paraglaciecola sp.]
MASFKLTEATKEDVINSYDFGLYQFGESQADNYHNQLEKRLNFLANNPYVAPLATGIDEQYRRAFMVQTLTITALQMKVY